MVPEETRKAIEGRFRRVDPLIDERTRRLLAASEAMEIGRGGITLLSDVTGLTRKTIRTGCAELKRGEVLEAGRIRRTGGGRKSLVEKDETLLPDLERLLSASTLGDPESPLLWTTKSLAHLCRELKAMGHSVSPSTLRKLLKQMGYRLQGNRKIKESGDHPDRNEQFERINSRTCEFQGRGQPVISVDTKKKELVGDFKNGGREYHKQGEAPEVRVHDFEIKDAEHGKVSPYGVYDIANNAGWVNVGTDHDTPAFAVASIERWWEAMGRHVYPEARELLIVADGGGSNGSRPRMWKRELQRLANETELEISVSHLPPGTSKWNKIEHRLFSHISMNWRGRPLVSHETVVNLIAATTTATGLTVRCGLDKREYPTGMKVSDEEMSEINITQDAFHGEWNYTISPNRGAG